MYSVSPAYKTFQIVDCNSTYLKYLLDINNSKLSHKYLITSARRGKSVDFEGFLKEKFIFPPLAEQKRIEEILNMARNEIDLLKKLVEQYYMQKCGLIQKLLSSKWKVVIYDTWEDAGD